MTEVIDTGPGARTADCFGYRAGYYSRSLVTRLGKLELRMPRDRDGRRFTEPFERYSQRKLAALSMSPPT